MRTLLPALLVACGLVAGSSAQTISGTVRDTDCSPIPGATVVVQGGSQPRGVISREGGVFVLRDLDARTYSLRAAIGGFYVAELQGVTPAPGGSSPLVVTLPVEEISLQDMIESEQERLPKNTPRRILVQDQECHPIAGAAVEILGGKAWKASTDTDGVVRTPSIRGAKYDVWIRADGYSPAVLRSARLPFRYQSDLTVSLRRGSAERVDVFTPWSRQDSSMNWPGSPAEADIRIVAMGDSTTAGTPAFKSPKESPPRGSGDEQSQYAYWLMKAHADWDVINQGVNAQRSDVIAARFDEDVIAKKPDVVVIIAGVNDVYQGRPAQHVKDQLAVMYRKARAAGIKVVAGTIIPYNTATADQNARMHDVNAWIRAQAEAGIVTFVDTRAAVAAPGDPDKLASSPDGLHPDTAGYRKMADAIEPAIKKLLR